MAKKLLLLLTLACSIPLLRSQVQIPNYNFETLNHKGTISHWGKTVLMSVNFDSLGHSIDSLVFDGDFYFPTLDAHSGLQAMEMRNAFNYGTGQGFAGGANLSNNDSDYSSFGTSLVRVGKHITDFSFYYKYLPVNHDSAVASIEVFDSNGLQIGEGIYIIADEAKTYTLANIHINFSDPGEVAYVSIHFSTFYTIVPMSRQAGLGSRLLVDDISLSKTSNISSFKANASVAVYPNPATGHFSILSKEPILGIEMLDMYGKTTGISHENVNAINTSALPSGMYIIRIITATAVLTRQLILE